MKKEKKMKGLPQGGCGHHLKVHTCTYEFGYIGSGGDIVIFLSTDIP